MSLSQDCAPVAWLCSGKGAIFYLSCCSYTGYIQIYSTGLTRAKDRITSTAPLLCPTTPPYYSAVPETLHSCHCRMQEANYFSADRLLKSRLTKSLVSHRSINSPVWEANSKFHRKAKGKQISSISPHRVQSRPAFMYHNFKKPVRALYFHPALTALLHDTLQTNSE